MTANPPLLAVEQLTVSFRSGRRESPAVEDVSFTLDAGETLAIVGESGSGKSVTSLAVMRLIPDPPGRINAGRILLNGKDLLALNDSDMQRIRGNDIAMIFQEPMTSLNPVMTVGTQIAESVRLHQGRNTAEARQHALDMLRRVQMPSPEQRLDQYPHELSGGMRQRIVIAMALACNPMLLIADEPTTALDVTVQAQVLDLMRTIRSELDAGVLLVTHDLGVVAEMADRVLVFYAGRVVESAPVRSLMRRPRHPYTLGLLGAMPRLSTRGGTRHERLLEIPGNVPPPGSRGPGCYFAPRCAYATQECRDAQPPLEEKHAGHLAACWHSDELEEPA
ncbi:ABC transporter ATP-binding protein [Chromatocurvus halotolerans]|uniref:ABC-type dipeptide transporter n=1 Tax=Chromatocurvus halotolerans TaxID=1132028 RepID=A0A4R2KU14_9GAMM|nr:ABC transporter ATP-binding protein [Chromatocurvus halotolerans]TCO77891.1 peptide/nickel transport system ATP-binding protein [Chromatocurvus halotolerans]